METNKRQSLLINNQYCRNITCHPLLYIRQMQEWWVRPKVLLNKYSGLASLGNYTFGVKFATLLHMVVSGIEKVWTPFFMNMANDKTEKSKVKIIERYFEIVFFIMLLGLCIIYFSEEMIKLLTTPEYYPAMFVTPIYVYITIFGLLGLLAVNQLMFIEKLVYLLPAAIINIIIYTVANIILIPVLGAVGLFGCAHGIDQSGKTRNPPGSCARLENAQLAATGEHWFNYFQTSIDA